MAPNAIDRSRLHLKVITQRLAATPVDRLPHIVPSVKDALIGCRDILSASSSGGSGTNVLDTTLLVHKFKTQLSSMLQAKNLESRWTSVVLIKATIEAGGLEVLKSAGPWARGMIGLLGVR